MTRERETLQDEVQRDLAACFTLPLMARLDLFPDGMFCEQSDDVPLGVDEIPVSILIDQGEYDEI